MTTFRDHFSSLTMRVQGVKLVWLDLTRETSDLQVPCQPEGRATEIPASMVVKQGPISEL